VQSVTICWANALRRLRLSGERRRNKGRRPCSKSKSSARKTAGGSAKCPELPGLLAYGATEAKAGVKTAALALRVIADRIEHGEPVPFDPSDLFVAA
jgi:predicted RNase H-like HicB family nuclease